MKHTRFIALLSLIVTASGGVFSAQESKVEVAQFMLRNMPDNDTYRTAFRMLENEAMDTPGWHEGLFDACKLIYVQDSIPDKDLSFAELTLESLASSDQTPKEIVFNASGILGNIAFNARDYDYLSKNIDRMQKTAKSLGATVPVSKAVAALQERQDMIKGYAVPFMERMTGTWVSAEVNYTREPEVWEIMPDRIRWNRYSITEDVKYNEDGTLSEKYLNPGTKEIVVSPKLRQIAAFFGYSQLQKGNEMLASAIADLSESLSGSLTCSSALRHRKNLYSTGNILSSAGSNLIGGLGMVLASALSESVKYTNLNNVYFTEIAPGIARIDIESVQIKESSQYGTTETHFPKSMYLYKITPEDSLAFAHYSKNKFKQPYLKDMCAYPYDVEDIDAYLESLNKKAIDSTSIHRKELEVIFKSLNSEAWRSQLSAAAYANYFMCEPLARVIQKHLDNTPEGLLDEATLREINIDLTYRIKNQDIFEDFVKINGFEGRENVKFQGVYSNKHNISYWARPRMLKKLLRYETRLPDGKPVFWRTDWENAAKDLRKNLYPVNGVMTWEKDGKSYRYEGEFYDRQFHGEGKLYENDNLIHDGRFEKGKPVVDQK